MPVFLNGKTTPTSKKPTQSLTKYYPLLTGRTTSSIGWFSSANQTVFDKIDSMGRIIEGLITANNGDTPDFTYESFNLSDLRPLIELTDKDQFLLQKNVPGDHEIYDVYLFGYEKMTTTVAHKQTNLLVPIIYAESSLNNLLISPTSLDPEMWSSYTEPTTSEILKNITMETLYNHSFDYYFHTNMRDLLTDMPKIAKTKSIDDTQIIKGYSIIKHFQATQPFNPIQLGAFVKELTLNSANAPLLNQLLLQFPELTFASLSEQFELAAPTFKPL